MSVAALPMYDWPEVASATDRLWAEIRDVLRDHGLPAPNRLSRGDDPRPIWKSPDLVLAQTCGYPFATELAGEVALVGTPAYAIGCRAGHYRSVIVVRREESRTTLAQLSRQAMAINGRDSQSGYHAPLGMFAKERLREPENIVVTGSHRNSIRAVAAGKADFAAIDKVTWHLALRHEKAAAALAVIAETGETPGLPLITSLGRARHSRLIFDCVSHAIAALDEESRDMLMIEGLVATEPGDYAPLAAD